jgi:hypothetical protein
MKKRITVVAAVMLGVCMLAGCGGVRSDAVESGADNAGIKAEGVSEAESGTVSDNADTEAEGYEMKTIGTEVKNGENTVVTIEVNYPELSGDSDVTDKINKAIAEDASNAMDNAVKNDEEFTNDAVNETDTNWGDDINYEVKRLDDDVLSLYVTEVTYLGGAHPNVTFRGVTYSLKTGETMRAEDFVEDALNKGKEGIKAMVKASPDEYPFYDDSSFEFTDDDFYVENGQLVFVVNPYEIAPYARGFVEYRMDIEG